MRKCLTFRISSADNVSIFLVTNFKMVVIMATKIQMKDDEVVCEN